MTLKLGERELNVAFGYEPTLKTRLLSRMAKKAVEMKDGDGDLEKIEDMLLFIPEVLLIGLQKEHKEEFGFNLDTNEGYEEQKNKVFSIVADGLDNGDMDCFDLFNILQDEMTKNGFLKKMFEKEVEKEEQKAQKTTE